MREDNIGLKSGKKKEQSAALNKGFCFCRLLYVSPECAVLFYLIVFMLIFLGVNLTFKCGALIIFLKETVEKLSRA
ncbi:hypothetical protein EHJ13_07355 [Cronobacter dublinensis]|uniref:Uncharacterized protein n=1 Tax=Cronobacter dublinensis TaxID=413497 RepID=A0A9Q4T5N9_9ENTR|nr:hypothetical protein [Cronobacter dublinensis]NCH87262.1 hypothetical protein [Cronobacter dublinensis]